MATVYWLNKQHHSHFLLNPGFAVEISFLNSTAKSRLKEKDNTA
jgi:hypothetical protein